MPSEPSLWKKKIDSGLTQLLEHSSTGHTLGLVITSHHSPVVSQALDSVLECHLLTFELILSSPHLHHSLTPPGSSTCWSSSSCLAPHAHPQVPVFSPYLVQSPYLVRCCVTDLQPSQLCSLFLTSQQYLLDTSLLVLPECSLSRSLLGCFILSPLSSKRRPSLFFGFAEITEAIRREHSPSLPCTCLSVSVPVCGAFPWPVDGLPLQLAKPPGPRSYPLTQSKGLVCHSQLCLLQPHFSPLDWIIPINVQICHYFSPL